MIDFRKVIISIVIAVLFTIFVFTLVEAVYPSPEYDQYCESMYDRPYNPNATPEELEAQRLANQECSQKYSDASDQHSFVVFLITAVLGLIATIVGMYIPASTPVGMSVASGLLLGGLFTLFIGTMVGWSGIGRVTRPIVMLVELCVVIWVSYRKLNETKSSKQTKKSKK